MRVIFSEDFLSDLKNTDNIISITEGKLIDLWSSIDNIEDLLNDSYVENCLNKVERIPIKTIWSSHDEVLRMCIDMTKEAVEKLSNISYEFIYCYYNNRLEEGVDKLAFILLNIESSSDNIMFNKIPLSINRNIINIKLENTKGRIITSNTGDNEFLEDFGVKLGDNLYKDVKGIGKVKKDTFLRYLRNSISNERNHITSSINIDGSQIYSSYSFRTYNNLKLYTEYLSESSENILSRNNLLNTGGIIKFQCKVDYTEYTCVNNVIKSISTGKLFNNELYPLTELVEDFQEDNKNPIQYKLDQENKRIIYSGNNNPKINVFSDFKLLLNYFNEIDNKDIVLESNIVRLNQNEGYTFWNVHHTSIFEENDASLGIIKVYILESEKDSSKNFYIDTDRNIREDEIAISSEGNFSDFFTITPTIEAKNGVNRININIKTNITNTGSSWNPVNTEGVSTLMKCIITIKDKVVSFYCVQKKPTAKLKLYVNDSLISDKPNYSEIKDLIFNNKEIKKNIYFTKEKSEKWKNIDNWILIKADSEVKLISTNGKINEKISTDLSLDSVPITITKESNNTEDLNFESLLFGLVSNAEVNTVYNDWKRVVDISTLEVPVKKLGEEPRLEVITTNDDNSIIFKNINVYSFIVKSNCSFKLSTNSKKYKFFDTNDNSIIYKTFNKSTGIEVFLKNITQDTDSIELEDLCIETIPSGDKKIIKVYQTFNKTLQSISKISPTEDIVFLKNKEKELSLNYSSTGTPYIEYLGGEKATIKETEIAFIKEVNGYLYHKSTLVADEDSKVPIRKLNTIKIKPHKLVDDFIKYDIYKLPTEPNVGMSDYKRWVYFKGELNDIKDFSISSKYKLNKKNIILDNSIKSCFNINLTEIYRGDDGYKYNLRVRTTAENLTESTINRGKISIISYIPPEVFSRELDYTQDQINKLISPSEMSFSLYQYSKSITEQEESLGIAWDETPIHADGEVRYCTVTGPKFLNVDLLETYNGTNVTFNEFQKRFIVTFQKNYPTGYKPFNISTDNGYTLYSPSRKVGFKTRIYTDKQDIVKVLKIDQLGINYGILYKSLNQDYTLFLGRNSENKVIELVNNTDEFLNLNVGLFNIQDKLTYGNVGERVKVYSNDEESQSYIYKENSIPIYNSESDTNSLSCVSLTIGFPKNNWVREKRRNFIIEATDKDNYIHKLNIELIQKGKNYQIYTDSIKNNLLLFHSSGKYMSRSYSFEIETNIPLANIYVKEKNITSLDYDIKYIGQSKTYLGFKIYSITVKLPSNTKKELHKSELFIGYFGKDEAGENITELIWKGTIRQGYLSASIIDESGNIIESGKVIGLRRDPLIYPAKNSGTDVDKTLKPFLVKFTQNEVDKNGELLEEQVYLDNWRICKDEEHKDSWNIDTSNDSTITSSLNTYFTNWGSLVSKSKEEWLLNKNPYLEHRYTVKPEYYKKNILLFISIYLMAYYPEDDYYCKKEPSSYYPFGFWILKSKMNLDIKVDPIEFNIKSNEETIRINIETEDTFDVISNSDWIVKKEVGKNYADFTITENTGNSDRSGYIEVKNSIDTIKVFVNQSKK